MQHPSFTFNPRQFPFLVVLCLYSSATPAFQRSDRYRTNFIIVVDFNDLLEILATFPDECYEFPEFFGCQNLAFVDLIFSRYQECFTGFVELLFDTEKRSQVYICHGVSVFPAQPSFGQEVAESQNDHQIVWKLLVING
jgi:hypothetical protein